MLLVVGGHARKIGKTAVVTELIAHLPEMRWTAIKITQHDPGPVAGYSIFEEPQPNQESDTGRYLLAGAPRAYWIEAGDGQLGAAVPRVRNILQTSEHAIVESNGILEFIRPDLCLVVLDFAARDFKPRSAEYVDRADAFVVIDRGFARPSWAGVPGEVWRTKPRFAVKPPAFSSPELVDFVKTRALGALE